VVTIGIGGTSLQVTESGWLLTFQLQQFQTSPVRLRVPLSISFGMQSEEIWVWMDAQATTTFEVLLSVMPLQLTLDPENLLLCQYQPDTTFLSFAPGSPIPLAIAGVAGVAIVATAIILIHRRRAK
jgi:hypothetical protein